LRGSELGGAVPLEDGVLGLDVGGVGETVEDGPVLPRGGGVGEVDEQGAEGGGAGDEEAESVRLDGLVPVVTPLKGAAVEDIGPEVEGVVVG